MTIKDGCRSRQDEWIASILARPETMSQRKLTVVEGWQGGLDALVEAARNGGVHLVQLTDDTGTALIAASRHPFKVLA